MSTTKLGNPSDAAHGLQGMQWGEPLDAFQGTIATATIGARVAHRPCKIQGLRAQAGTGGSAGSTVVQVHLNGVSQGEVTLDSADADPVSGVSVPLDVDVVPGDLIELVVSTAPTAGADLSATADIVQSPIS